METEIMTASGGTVALLNKSEIDQQIATAHQFPRSIKQFRDETMQLVTLSEQVAGECVYSLPRSGANIEGPSARFAEIVINSWGNCRVGARVVMEDKEFVTAQGVFHDLEKNSAITYEVKRRIVDKHGRRFKPDMIGVTANAACSIALRNAALKGVPKAFWSEMYDAARQTVMGDIQTLANRRVKMLAALLRYGVTEDIVFQFLDVTGIEDITLENMATLKGLGTSLKEGETSVERIKAELAGSSGKASSLDDLLKEDSQGEMINKDTGEAIGQDTKKGIDPAQLIKLIEDADSIECLDDVSAMTEGLDKRSKEYKDIVAHIAVRRQEFSE